MNPYAKELLERYATPYIKQILRDKALRSTVILCLHSLGARLYKKEDALDDTLNG